MLLVEIDYEIGRHHFSLASLPFQLSDTKAVDNKRNLLHFLAETVENSYPDIMGFTEELFHVNQASKGCYNKCHHYYFSSKLLHWPALKNCKYLKC